jgi:hypothetical protein
MRLGILRVFKKAIKIITEIDCNVTDSIFRNAMTIIKYQ